MSIKNLCFHACYIVLSITVFATSSSGAEFPVEGILPKQETGAIRFLEQHPEYDGRGVVVAIFDTGVDPGAAGLQTTTDGKPKIVDMVDGSGSGDVDTSTVRKQDGDTIEGLTGRKLKIPKKWKNPSGKFHVGIKRAYELFPENLVPRLKKKRRENWDAGQRALLTKLEHKIISWDKAHPKPKDGQKKTREDLQARLDLLKEVQTKYDDPGPIFDCVVFNDGKVWRAAIDTDEDGDLYDEKLMTNYRLEREYATFGDEDLLNFAVNIYDAGKLLSIVSDCGAHGTHVAGIVAGHYPDKPELNGLAPGAQIVSVKIGDSRLGSNSTETGEVRGLIAVLENKCDLINMSYGGDTSDPNHGHNIELFSEIVNKHGVIWVASAGNSGPALSTAGTPGGTTTALIGVGAYVSPAMMAAEYSLRKTLPEMPYTWTARGPTFDGDLGVNVCAPGGAISPVPNWVLQPNMLMNGTSMASPNACGGIALLLSGLKSEKIEYTPHSIRRALENTARPLEGGDPFSHGRGLLQVDTAFEHLTKCAEATGEQLRFEVDIPGRNGDRGVYLREPFETQQTLEASARVRPIFHDDANNRDKVAFELRVALESTADWIETPEHLLLINGGRTFSIKVDPTELTEGVHFAQVCGYDAANRDRGPLFRLPVTVVRPCQIKEKGRPSWSSTQSFEPGQFERQFIAVPEGATWADLTVRASQLEAPQRIVVHALQKLPKKTFRAGYRQFITVEPGSETVRSFQVVGGRTLELCLGQYWSNLAESEFKFELAFHGLVPSDPELQINGSLLSARVDVTATLCDESLNPKSTLNTLRHSIRPSEAQIHPLRGSRDQLPDERQIHEMILTYKFQLDGPAEVTPRVALLLQDEAWESWQSMIWQIFDSGKRLMASGTDDTSTKLPKGKFVVRAHLRHDQVQQLEKLKQMPLLLDRKLPKPISLGVYADPDDAINAGRSFGTRVLHHRDLATLYFSTPKSYPKPSEPGDLLIGTVTLGEEEKNKSGAGQRPGGFPITLLVPPTAADSSKKEPSAEPKKEKSLAEQLQETKLARLAALRTKKDQKAFDKLAAQMLKSSPDDQRVLIEQLMMLDNDDRKQRLPEIVTAADKIINAIDDEELAKHYGVKLNPDDKKAAEVRKKMDEKKEILVDALYRKGRALAYMDLPPKYSKPDEPPVKQFPEKKKDRDKLFEQNFAELQKWVDVTESKYVLLLIRRERRHNRQGLALKALNNHITESPPKNLLFKKRGDIYDELGWHQWRDYERKWMILRFPANYPPF